MSEYQPINISPQMVILPRDLAEMALKALYGPDKSPDEALFKEMTRVEAYDMSPYPKKGTVNEQPREKST